MQARHAIPVYPSPHCFSLSAASCSARAAPVMLNNTEFVDIEAEMLSTNGTTRNPPGQDNGPRSHFINRGFAPSVSVPSVKSFSLVPFLFSSFCEIRIAPVLVVGREKMKTGGETRLHVPDYLITISDQCKSGAPEGIM